MDFASLFQGLLLLAVSGALVMVWKLKDAISDLNKAVAATTADVEHLTGWLKEVSEITGNMRERIARLEAKETRRAARMD